MAKKNYKMKTYFGLGFGIILALLLVIIGAGYYGINSLSKQVIYMLETDAIVAEHSARARANVLGLRRYEKDVFLNITNIKKVKSYAKKWIGQYKSTVARIQGMEKGVTLEKDKQTLKLMRKSLEQYKSGWEKVLSRIESGEIKTPQEGNAAIKKYKDPVRQLIITAKNTATKGNKRLKSIKSTVENITSNLSLFLILAALATFVFGILIALYCIKAITRQIGLEPSDLREISDKIAQGDLTLSLTDNDNATGIFATLLLMKKKLNQAITNVKNSTQSIKSGSEQVSGSSLQLSQGTAEQASSVEEITSSITELTSQSKQAAANAEDVSNISKEALGNARGGIDKMNGMVSAMNDISESSDKISKIMKTIEEIAFQTNLLALNAAVEAARAGRHGKGFAVVAEEVNNLSKRSSVAAKETAEIIDNIIKKIDGGKALTSQSQESFQKILDGIQNVNKLVEEITTASSEQVKGIEQVENGIQQIDKVTQSNASIAEENAAASEDLSRQAGKLAKIVSRFQLHNEDQRAITEASQGGNGHKILETEKDGQKVLPAPRGTMIDPKKVISLGENRQDYTKF